MEIIRDGHVPKGGSRTAMGLKTKRHPTQAFAGTLDAEAVASACRSADSDRAAAGGLDTAARAVLRNRRRCQPVPGVEAIHGDARP